MGVCTLVSPVWRTQWPLELLCTATSWELSRAETRYEYTLGFFSCDRHDSVHSFPWCTFSQPNIHPFWLPERKPKPSTYCLLTAKCCFRGCKRRSAEYQWIWNVPVTTLCKIQNTECATLTEKCRYLCKWWWWRWCRKKNSKRMSARKEEKLPRIIAVCVIND